MFSDVFGSHFPRVAICQQGRRFLLRDLRSPLRTVIHIQAKPPVRADGFFFLTAISHDSRMFSDVFGPHFPRAAIHQQGWRFLLRDLRSPLRTAIHIQAKPPVWADGTFPPPAISHDNRMFSDVFGSHFPRVAICQQGRRFLLRDLASSPRARSRAREAIGPDGAFPRPQSVATAACSTILPAHVFHAQLFTNGSKSSVARCILSPRAWQALGLLYAMSGQSLSLPHAVGHGDRQFP